jgi:putative hydrolase of the HAD superfamily
MTLSDDAPRGAGAASGPSLFADVETWVFDLDNTLYSHDLRLFDQVSALMTDWVMRELGLDRPAADALRARYWREHGTTLAGLMAVNGVEPEPFLEAVHAIDLSAVAPDRRLDAALARLPGRKVVYTNGSRGHAERVTGALGLRARFDAVYGIEDAGFAPKPRRAAFDRVFAADGLAPARAAMVEDDQRNLEVPFALGMQTVWAPIDPEEPAAPHVRHVAIGLAGFLEGVIAGMDGW